MGTPGCSARLLSTTSGFSIFQPETYQSFPKCSNKGEFLRWWLRQVLAGDGDDVARKGNAGGRSPLRPVAFPNTLLPAGPRGGEGLGMALLALGDHLTKGMLNMRSPCEVPESPIVLGTC